MLWTEHAIVSCDHWHEMMSTNATQGRRPLSRPVNTARKRPEISKHKHRSTNGRLPIFTSTWSNTSNTIAMPLSANETVVETGKELVSALKDAFHTPPGFRPGNAATRCPPVKKALSALPQPTPKAFSSTVPSPRLLSLTHSPPHHISIPRRRQSSPDSLALPASPRSPTRMLMAIREVLPSVLCSANASTRISLHTLHRSSL